MSRTTIRRAPALAVGVALASGAGLLMPTAMAGTSQSNTAGGQGVSSNSVWLDLKPSSPALKACYPHAQSKVKVDLTTDKLGFDTVSIASWGLKPKTQFTLFFLEKSGAPFGAAEYFGDFTTDKYGRGYGQFKLIAEEAFAFDNVTHVRKDLNYLGFWFADPKDDDGCLGVKSPVTGFDGDGEAGVQMMNSGVKRLP